MVKQFSLFDVAAYIKRLQLLRAMYGEGQKQFADRLGIPMKRWNQYERGYPVSRETAWMLHQKIPGIATDWIWFGEEHKLTEDFRARLRAAEKLEAERAVEELKQLRARRKSAAKALGKVRNAAKGSNAAE